MLLRAALSTRLRALLADRPTSVPRRAGTTRRMPPVRDIVTEDLLDVRELVVEYAMGKELLRPARRLRAVNGITFALRAGETLGLVGESGCGKTSMARAVMRLVPAASGEVRFEGSDLLRLKGEELRRRRRALQIVFQNPFASLDPRMAVEALVAEPLVTHTDLKGSPLRKTVLELSERVGLSEVHLSRFAHQLSGGQAQRVAIARALALAPRLIVLDEPTSALDVSVQAQILNLLKRLQGETGVSYMFISHDLSVVQHMSDRIGVMYLGELVELGPAGAIFDRPAHPYTQALIASMPRIEGRGRASPALGGVVPSLADPPPGCRFHTRCPYAYGRCSTEIPSAIEAGQAHWARCHLLDEAPEARPRPYAEALQT
jgi:oligopeptide transport system ATP-binding protein